MNLASRGATGKYVLPASGLKLLSKRAAATLKRNQKQAKALQPAASKKGDLKIWPDLKESTKLQRHLWRPGAAQINHIQCYVSGSFLGYTSGTLGKLHMARNL